MDLASSLTYCVYVVFRFKIYVVHVTSKLVIVYSVWQQMVTDVVIYDINNKTEQYFSEKYRPTPVALKYNCHLSTIS